MVNYQELNEMMQTRLEEILLAVEREKQMENLYRRPSPGLGRGIRKSRSLFDPNSRNH